MVNNAHPSTSRQNELANDLTKDKFEKLFNKYPYALNLIPPVKKEQVSKFLDKQEDLSKNV